MRMGQSSPRVRPPLLLAVITLFWIAVGCTVPPRESAKMSNDTKSQAVRIDWRFDAAPESVWAAWTDPSLVRQWFGSDPNGEVLAAALDVKPRGRFEVTFANADGTQYTAMGVYQEVEPVRLLQFSWQWKNEPGVETAIRVVLSPDGTGTRMQFQHAGLLHLSTHDYASGWRSTFEKMQKAISRSAAE